MFPLWAGLLIVSSLAPLFAGASDRTGELSVRVDDGLVSVTAHNVSVQDVQHVALDRIITLNLDRQPLPDVLDEILKNDSYQLYQGVSNEAEAEADNPVPSTLWIFSEGSSLAPAATVFFEAVFFTAASGKRKKQSGSCAGSARPMPRIH